MRGLPGSGKSTLAKQLAGQNGQVFSADDYFQQGNEYKHDAKQLPLAHVWNQQRILNAIAAKIPTIVVDNTNVTRWEMEQLRTCVQKAKDAGYNVEIKMPDTPWAWNAEELARRNQHNVPLSTIQKRLNKFDHDVTVNDILGLPAASNN